MQPISTGFERTLNLLARIEASFSGPEKPLHLRHGDRGEWAAKRFLQRLGMKFFTANFRSDREEIDLIFRDRECLQFVYIGLIPARERAPFLTKRPFG